MNPAAPPEQHEPPLIDLSFLLLLLGFVLRAVARHRVLVIASFLTIVGAAAGMLAIMPRTYSVDTRILTEPDTIVSRLTGAERDATQRATRRAAELIRARENLLGIIDDIDLVQTWRERRSGLARLLDKVKGAINGPITDAMVRDALVEMFERRLWASVDGDVLVISANWTEPDTTKRIVEVAKSRFLAERRLRETAEIDETILILERAVESKRVDLDHAAQRVREAWRQKKQPLRAPAAARRSADTAQDAQRFERDLQYVTEEVARIERAYQDRVRQAQSRLDDLQATLGPAHPDVAAAVRDLEANSRPPKELAELRAKEARLTADARTQKINSQTESRGADVERVIRGTQPMADPEFDALVDNYKQEGRELEDLVGRLEKATLELGIAKIAFDYRYVVTLPPLLPRRPIKPNPKKTMMAAIMAGLLLSIAFAVLVDWRSKVIHEPWQVEHLLKLPVLGDVHAKSSNR